MEETEKTAWIDEENKIVSFRAMDNAEMIVKAESLFWDFRITIENETAELEMDYNDMTIYWAYGD